MRNINLTILQPKMNTIKSYAILLPLIYGGIVCSQDVQSEKKELLPQVSMPVKKSDSEKWSDKVSIRGYMQVRHNGFYQSNPDLTCPQCDRSWGGNNEFFIRRTRIIFFGQIHPRVFMYIQPDFASSVSSSNLHFTQLRDAYFDLGLDSKNEFRLRIGQSKVPYGFENMQSSQNRLPLDRNDALNSAVLNERDLGVFFYWAPKEKRKLLRELTNKGYKGSGDYGIFAFGVYDGQTANKPDLNNGQHYVARITYPFVIGSQIIEPSIQAYSGLWTIDKALITSDVTTNNNATYLDQRIAVTTNLYPKPFGFLAEYTVGTGPDYNKNTNTIDQAPLRGGFVTFNYLYKYKSQAFFPFVRMHHYSGGKKFEQDARRYKVNEYEFGVEWQPFYNFELVVMHTYSLRRYEDAKLINNFQEGNLLRIQAQFNF